MSSGQRIISTRVMFQDVDIAKDGYSEGNTQHKDLDLTTIANNGIFSAQVEIESGSDSTSITITWYESNDGVNYIAGGTIVAAVDVSSGLDAKYSFEPQLCKWLRIRVTENDTGSAGIVDCTITLAVQ